MLCFTYETYFFYMRKFFYQLFWILCFLGTSSSIKTKMFEVDWEQPIYQSLFVLANTLSVHMFIDTSSYIKLFGSVTK